MPRRRPSRPLPSPDRERQLPEPLERERREARRLWPRLSRLDERRLIAALHFEGVRPTWGLFARFLNASRSATARDAPAARLWARTAARIAQALEPSGYPPLAITDLISAAAAAEAEALRFLGRPFAAGERVRAARRAISATPDSRFLAEIDRIEAGIASDLGDAEAADRLSQRALLAAPRAPDPAVDPAGLARSHVERALAVAPFDPIAAADACARALRLPDWRQSAARAATAVLLAEQIFETGETEQASALLAFAAEAEGEDLDELGRVHALWLRARIDRRRDRFPALRRADDALRRVVPRLEALGRERERSLAELDLAEIEVLSLRLVPALDRIHALRERLLDRGAHDELALTLRCLVDVLIARVEPAEAFDQARLYLRRAWWSRIRPARRAPAAWDDAEIPFAHLAQPIARAYSDARTFEAGMHLSMLLFPLTSRATAQGAFPT